MAIQGQTTNLTGVPTGNASRAGRAADEADEADARRPYPAAAQEVPVGDDAAQDGRQLMDGHRQRLRLHHHPGGRIDL